MRRLLFIVPVMPAPTGNGLAMRAGMFLEAFARTHEVSLLVVPVAGAADGAAIPEFVGARVARVIVLRPEECLDPWFGLIARLTDEGERDAALAAYPLPALCRLGTRASVRAAAERFASIAFDVVHVFRVYLAPFAEPFLASRSAGRPACVLDLDDDESRSRRRLADLHTRRGSTADARREASEADKYERLERSYLPRFDRILVCTAADGAEVQRRLGLGQIVAVPNAVRIPATVRRSADRGGRLLFVGTLGHFPNEDGARFFCEEVLPRLRARMGGRVATEIVGSNPSTAVHRLAEDPDVVVRGRVDSVEPHYAAADLAIVPLRAGGGTRIKVLEAFAHGVPVVSTTIGAEGLDVVHGRHLLLADGPDDFADACARLLRDGARAAELADAARALVVVRYALPTVTAAIERLFRELCGDEPEP